MIDQRHRLGVIRLIHPDFFNPVPFKGRIKLFKGGDKTFEQLLITHRKIFVTGFQIIPGVDDMIAAKMILRDKIGMLHQCQHGIARLFRQVEPVIAFFR